MGAPAYGLDAGSVVAGADGDTWGGGGLAGGSLALGGRVGLLSALAWV